MKISDENKELKIWSITNENKEDLEYRGCITDKDNNIICPSLGYIYEYNIELVEEGKVKVINPEDWKWSYSVEGTMLRLYFYNHEWYLSTHKKISAFQSRWSCKFSFGELFIHTLEEIFPEKENVYEWFNPHTLPNTRSSRPTESNTQGKGCCVLNNRLLFLRACILFVYTTLLQIRVSVSPTLKKFYVFSVVLLCMPVLLCLMS